MRSPLQRIRRGAVLLVATFCVAVGGYAFSDEYSLLDAVWMTVVTISSVGFSEKSTLDPQLKMFTVGVILVGMSAAGYTLGGIFQMITEGEIERAMGRRRLTREIEQMNNHIVICGFGRMGHVIASEFLLSKNPFVVVDNDEKQVTEAGDAKYLCIQGDATEDDVLLAAGVPRARTLVTCLPNDAENVFITLTARDMNPNVHIVARAEFETSERKLRQAGANRIVLPTVLGAHRMVRMVTRPSTADLMELVSESRYMEFELDEITVPEDCGLVGTSVRETEAHRRHRLLVVAVKQADGNMVFNPDAEYKFRGRDVVILMGRPDDIQRFRDEHSI